MAEPRVDFAPIVLAREIGDREAQLATVDGRLAAILVRLDHPAYEDIQGHWVLEVGFGCYDVTPPPVFPTLGVAWRWLAARASGA